MKYKLLSIALVIATTPAHAAVIVSLSPVTADYAGGANTGTSIGGTTQADGLTFNITFTPTAADLTGLVTLMEIGGQTNGTALYLFDGTPVFLSKTGGGSEYTIPDTTFDGSGIAVQHSGGSLTAGVQTTVAAIYNNALGDLTLAVGSTPVTSTISISNPQSNWNGNNSLSVGTMSGNVGDRSGTFGDTAAAFGTDVKSLAGTVDGDAYYWNSSAATVIPEPSTAILACLGGMLGLLRRRRG